MRRGSAVGWYLRPVGTVLVLQGGTLGSPVSGTDTTSSQKCQPSYLGPNPSEGLRV